MVYVISGLDMRFLGQNAEKSGRRGSGIAPEPLWLSCFRLEEQFRGDLQLAWTVEGVVGARGSGEGRCAGSGEGTDAALELRAGGAGGLGGGVACRLWGGGCGRGGWIVGGVGGVHAGDDAVVEEIEGLAGELELDGLVDGDV